ncbi:MAG TPA: LytTR family DNA-binding domain-containing protein [Thermoanaerobaculia bacterium]|nr:LytTR family DNA-binding domain-containing protein [Thermoanaerobaculia bacterium]
MNVRQAVRTMRPIRTVLVDDEPLAREALRSLLADEDDIEVVAEFPSGTAFLRDAAGIGADLVFLDVEMPTLSGLEVLEQLHAAGAQPHVVFVTGFDQYAVRAFEEQALDYVLKPYRADRMAITLTRLRQQMARAAESPAAAFLTRVAVRKNARIHLVKIDDVDWLETAGNYVSLHAGASEYLYRTTMAAIESRLDPERFVRIHRSTIVNVDRIVELQPTFGRELVVLLRDGARLRLGAPYRDGLRKLIEGL